MRVGLHTDQTKFPNLVAMKLSAHHKAAGDDALIKMAKRQGDLFALDDNTQLCGCHD